MIRTIKNILIFSVLFFSIAVAQNPVLYVGGDILGNVYAGDYDGATEYFVNHSPNDLDLNDTNRVLTPNNDFESDGDSYIKWTATGNHSFDSSSTALTGTYSGMIVSDTTETPVIDEEFTAGITDWTSTNSSSYHYDSDWNGVSPPNGGALLDSVTVASSPFVAFNNNIIIQEGITYKLWFVYYLPSANTLGEGIKATNNTTAFTSVQIVQDAWTTVNTTFTATEDGQLRFYLCTDVGGVTVTVGDKFYIDNVILYQYSGDADSNYAYLPAADFTALEHGNKYTFQMEAQSVGVNGSDLATSLANGGTFDYETFTTSGDSASSVINSADWGGGHTNNIGASSIGDIYRVQFTLTLNSGELPFLRMTDGTTGVSGNKANEEDAVDGYNDVYFTMTANTSNTYFQFSTLNGEATNFVIDDVDVFAVTPPDLTLAIGDSSWTFSDVDPTSGGEVLVKNFEWDTTGNPTPDIKLYSSQPDTIYIDEVDISEAYDWSWNQWVNVTTTGNKWLATFDASGNFALELRATDLIRFRLGGFSNTTALTSGSWHLVSLVRDAVAGTCSLYVDGVAKVGRDISTYARSLFAISKVELNGLNGGTFFEGYIGETQIVRGYALTAAEILANYNNGIKGKPFSDSYSDGTIISWWKFAGKDNTVFLQDEQGNNDLTGVNMDQENDQVKLKKYSD